MRDPVVTLQQRQFLILSLSRLYFWKVAVTY